LELVMSMAESLDKTVLVDELERNLWETWSIFGSGPDCYLYEEEDLLYGILVRIQRWTHHHLSLFALVILSLFPAEVAFAQGNRPEDAAIGAARYLGMLFLLIRKLVLILGDARIGD
jgi:hypothetical protein